MRTGRPVGGGLVLKPTGSCRPALTGGGIALLSSIGNSGFCLLDELLVLRLERLPSSARSSSSSASALLTSGIVPLLVAVSAALDLVRGLLFGACALVESAFLCFAALVTL